MYSVDALGIADVNHSSNPYDIVDAQRAIVIAGRTDRILATRYCPLQIHRENAHATVAVLQNNLQQARGIGIRIGIRMIYLLKRVVDHLVRLSKGSRSACSVR